MFDLSSAPFLPSCGNADIMAVLKPQMTLEMEAQRRKDCLAGASAANMLCEAQL